MRYKQKSLDGTTHSIALLELIHLSTLSTKKEKKSSKKRDRNTTTAGYATQPKQPKQPKQLSLRIKSPTSKLQNNPASLRSEGGWPICSEVLSGFVRKGGRFGRNTQCRDAGLPAPEFEQRGDQFVLTIWRVRLTEKALAQLGLNNRQKKAVNHVKKNGPIGRKEYVSLTGVSVRQANFDLADLVEKKVFDQVGKGRAVRYILYH